MRDTHMRQQHINKTPSAKGIIYPNYVGTRGPYQQRPARRIVNIHHGENNMDRGMREGNNILPTSDKIINKNIYTIIHPHSICATPICADNNISIKRPVQGGYWYPTMWTRDPHINNHSSARRIVNIHHGGTTWTWNEVEGNNILPPLTTSI